jgi:hypothetical protein
MEKVIYVVFLFFFTFLSLHVYFLESLFRIEPVPPKKK